MKFSFLNETFCYARIFIVNCSVGKKPLEAIVVPSFKGALVLPFPCSSNSHWFTFASVVFVMIVSSKHSKFKFEMLDLPNLEARWFFFRTSSFLFIDSLRSNSQTSRHRA